MDFNTTGQFTFTTLPWCNKLEDGDWKKVLYHTGTIDTYERGTHKPAIRHHGHCPEGEHVCEPVQRGIVCSFKARTLCTDVDEPMAYLYNGIPLNRTHATSTRGEGYHVLVDFSHIEDLTEDEWPTQGHIHGGDIKSNGFVPVPGSVHYSGEKYEPTGNPPLRGTRELLATLRSAQAAYEPPARAGGTRSTGATGQAAGRGDDTALAAYTFGLVFSGLTDEEIYPLWRARADELQDPNRAPFTDANFKRHVGSDGSDGSRARGARLKYKLADKVQGLTLTHPAGWADSDPADIPAWAVGQDDVCAARGKKVGASGTGVSSSSSNPTHYSPTCTNVSEIDWSYTGKLIFGPVLTSVAEMHKKVSCERERAYLHPDTGVRLGSDWEGRGAELRLYQAIAKRLICQQSMEEVWAYIRKTDPELRMMRYLTRRAPLLAVEDGRIWMRGDTISPEPEDDPYEHASGRAIPTELQDEAFTWCMAHDASFGKMTDRQRQSVLNSRQVRSKVKLDDDGGDQPYRPFSLKMVTATRKRLLDADKIHVARSGITYRKCHRYMVLVARFALGAPPQPWSRLPVMRRSTQRTESPPIEDWMYEFMQVTGLIHA